MDVNQEVTNSIKQCMIYTSLTKDYIKILRINKSLKPIKINRRTKNILSIQFQNNKKTALVIPRVCGQHHIQIHIDKHYRLVKFIRRRLNLKHLIYTLEG